MSARRNAWPSAERVQRACCSRRVMFEDGDPSITGDGLHLMYASSRGPNGTSDLYMAERRWQ